MIKLLGPNEFLRFSECFLCFSYLKNDGSYNYVKRYLCLLNKKIYEFDTSDNYTNEFDLSNEIQSCYYNLLIDSTHEKLNYFISYIGKNNHLNIFSYSFTYYWENNSLNEFIEINDTIIYNQKSYTCQIDISNNELICFYILKPKLYAEIFDLDNFKSKKKQNTSCNCEDINNTIITMKSSKLYKLVDILVCWEQKDNKAYCIIYNKNSGFETNFKALDECEVNEQLMDTFLESTNFIFICQLKADKNKYKYFKMAPDSEGFNEVNEITIQDKGFLLFNAKYRLYNKSNDICNLSYNTSQNNYLDENIINIPLTSNPLTTSIIVEKSYSSVPSNYYSLNTKTISLSTNYFNYPPNTIPLLPRTNFKEDELLLNITNIKKDELLLNMEYIFQNKEPGKTYKIKGDDYIIIIKPSNSTMEPNSTYIKFTECESILREHYNISDSSFITLLQIELYNDNSNSLINQVEYQAYGENFTKLNLNLCKDANIHIFYAIKDDILLDIEKINSLKNLGFDIFNINDSFFLGCLPILF